MTLCLLLVPGLCSLRICFWTQFSIFISIKEKVCHIDLLCTWGMYCSSTYHRERDPPLWFPQRFLFFLCLGLLAFHTWFKGRRVDHVIVNKLYNPQRQIGICDFGLYKLNLIDWLKSVQTSKFNKLSETIDQNLANEFIFSKLIFEITLKKYIIWYTVIYMN